MHVYSEDASGNAVYSFTYVDKVLDTGDASHHGWTLPRLWAGAKPRKKARFGSVAGFFPPTAAPGQEISWMRES